MWKWKRTNLKTGKEELVQVQGALRPIQLWEYIIPESSFDELMTVLKPERWSLSKTRQAVLRKMLGKGTAGEGVEPIPKYKDVPTNKFVETGGVAIYPIGIKKDPDSEMEEWGYKQEML